MCDPAKLTKHIPGYIQGALSIASSAVKEVMKGPFHLPLPGAFHSGHSTAGILDCGGVIIIINNNKQGS